MLERQKELLKLLKEAPIVPIKLGNIDSDPRYRSQIRASLDETVLEKYRKLFEEGEQLAPIQLIVATGRSIPCDGFHRCEALKQASLETTWENRDILSQSIVGTLEDIELMSLCVNATHGHPRSSSDTRRAIIRAWSKPQFTTYTDAQIGQLCGGVPGATIWNYKKEIKTTEESHLPALAARWGCELTDLEAAANNLKKDRIVIAKNGIPRKISSQPSAKPDRTPSSQVRTSPADKTPTGQFTPGRELYFYVGAEIDTLNPGTTVEKAGNHPAGGAIVTDRQRRSYNVAVKDLLPLDWEKREIEDRIIENCDLHVGDSVVFGEKTGTLKYIFLDFSPGRQFCELKGTIELTDGTVLNSQQISNWKIAPALKRTIKTANGFTKGAQIFYYCGCVVKDLMPGDAVELISSHSDGRKIVSTREDDRHTVHEEDLMPSGWDKKELSQKILENHPYKIGHRVKSQITDETGKIIDIACNYTTSSHYCTIIITVAIDGGNVEKNAHIYWERIEESTPIDKRESPIPPNSPYNKKFALMSPDIFGKPVKWGDNWFDLKWSTHNLADIPQQGSIVVADCALLPQCPLDKAAAIAFCEDFVLIYFGEHPRSFRTAAIRYDIDRVFVVFEINI
jgi:hypothetical protein